MQELILRVLTRFALLHQRRSVGPDRRYAVQVLPMTLFRSSIMKDLVHRLAIVLFLGCFFVSASSQSQDISPELKQKTFEEVWQTVNNEFFDPNFNGVDWKAARDRYAPRVAATKTEAEFYDVLNQMLAELKVSHMRVLTPNELGKSKQVAATTGLGLRDVGGQLVIARILHGSSAEKAGLKTGYVVTAIDGKPVKTLAEAKQPLGGAAGTTLKVAYLDERDQPREVTLERVGLTASDKGSVGAGLNSYFLFEAVRLRSNIGYIRFTSFLDTA